MEASLYFVLGLSLLAVTAVNGGTQPVHRFDSIDEYYQEIEVQKCPSGPGYQCPTSTTNPSAVNVQCVSSVRALCEDLALCDNERMCAELEKLTGDVTGVEMCVESLRMSICLLTDVIEIVEENLVLPDFGMGVQFDTSILAGLMVPGIDVKLCKDGKIKCPDGKCLAVEDLYMCNDDGCQCNGRLIVSAIDAMRAADTEAGVLGQGRRSVGRKSNWLELFQYVI
ncbi:uncharacterized protein [Ptychodera flava]|uniref:uncharacterized protein n=1 Tax=Ptychodera flava TaxID=63121 RepID=UPI003969DE56